MTSIGSATADAGEVGFGRLVVGEGRDGAEVGLPVAVVNGAADGKTLYLQAASDGNELNGIGVLQRLVPELDPADVAGTILVVGIVNYYGFHAGQHRNPIDDTKLNRAYPGNERGSSSERLAAATFELAKRADVVLDLHQGSDSRMIDETRVRCGRHHRLYDECLELAKVFDCGHVLDRTGPTGQLARVAPNEGVPTIDPELGGAVGWDEESIRTGKRGVVNVLKHYGFVDGTARPKEQVVATGFDRYVSPSGGLVTFHRDLGDRVRPGDVLFEVTDVFGDVRATVAATGGGIFWRTRRLPQVASGEYVCSVGTGVGRR